MATWTIEADAEGRQQVRYTNPQTSTFDLDLGRSTEPISAEAIVAWAASESAPLDLIFVGRQILVVLHPAEA